MYNRVKHSLNHVIIGEQHGIRPWESTIISSVELFSSYIVECLEQKNQIDVIFTDFRKLFETVDHFLIINELQGLGIGYPLLTWLKSYQKEQETVC